MTKRILIYNLIAMFAAASILSGCGSSSEVVKPTENRKKAEITSMLEEAETDYEIPEVYPLISVDLKGYDVKDKKVAVISSVNIPSRFNILDSSTKEVVYTGQVKKADISEGDGLNTGYLDFSDFNEEGSYYIEADIVGCSEYFTIKQNLYREMLKESFAGIDSMRCNKCHSGMLPLETNPTEWIDVSGGWHTGDDGQKDVVEGCDAVYDLTLTYEYFKSLCKDNMDIKESGNGIPDILDEIMYEADWLLKMQNPATGGVYTSVSVQKLDGSDNESLVVGGETTKATAHFCAIMARLSYLTANLDNGYSVKYMKAANLAWKCLEANREIVGKDQMYHAAVEMYRATGYGVYSNIILNYLKDNSAKAYDSRHMLDAAITYLDTPRFTDKDHCDNLMAAFMDKTEKHAALAQNARYLVEPGDKSVRELLRNACELVIVDYIISSSAYSGIEKNYIHFIGGRNEKSIICTSTNDPDVYAELILLCTNFAE